MAESVRSLGLPVCRMKTGTADQALIERLFDLSGLNDGIQQIPENLLAGFDDTARLDQNIDDLPRGVLKEIKASLRNAFAPRQIRKKIFAELRVKMSREDIEAALQWFQSSLGQKIVAIEGAAGGSEKIAEFAVYKERIQSSPPPQERLQMILDLDAAVKASDNASKIASSMQKALVIALIEAKPKEQQLPVEDLERWFESRRAETQYEIKGDTLLHLLYTYKDLSGDDLNAYTAFASTLPGIIFNHASICGLKKALIEAGYRYGEAIAKILANVEGRYDI
jgi:hypothetical protein